jgi:SET domain-containing protein
VFEWSRGKRAVALGVGSLFNHSTVPNAWWEVVKDKRVLRFYAAKTIAAGEEILVNYGYQPQ